MTHKLIPIFTLSFAPEQLVVYKGKKRIHRINPDDGYLWLPGIVKTNSEEGMSDIAMHHHCPIYIWMEEVLNR